MTKQGQWRPVHGYEAIYMVSDQGQIKRVGRARGAQHGRIKRLQCDNSTGYLKVDLYRKSKRQSFFVHRLVAVAFLGLPPVGTEVNHKNGIKTDNRPQNLEWVSRSENALHALAMGLKMPFVGENAPGAKLTNDEVRKIRALYRSGKYMQKQLATQFGIARSGISRLVRGENYGSVYHG